MRARLLPYLKCPDCGGEIHGEFEGELEEGELNCLGCQRTFPVQNGIPSILPSQLDALTAQVAGEFGEQWQRYSERREEYRQQFLDWIRPVPESFFPGKVILDGGCGKGRHLEVASSLGPELVIGVDLGEAIYVAREATRELDNVELVRGDMLNLPFREGVFDYGYSVGVLHHLPDPQRGFQQLVDKIRSGGHVSAWVYGLENNEWIVNFVDPIRHNITNRLPRPVLQALSWVLGWLVVGVARGIYRPWNQRFPGRRLFYQDYLLYISKFPHKEVESIVYDQLNPEIAYYLPKETFESWFEELTEVTIAWHNSNSWRGFASKP